MIKKPILIKKKKHVDKRGYFQEIYLYREFKINILFTAKAYSKKNVIRGLHFQKPPFEQAKLVRCIEGNVIDVAVDIRKGSPTYGMHLAVELSGENKRQLFVPRGFAHGFAVLSETAVFSYKVDNIYAPKYDSGIKFNDKDLNINWVLNEEDIQLSEKDKNLESFKDLDSPFNFLNS